jgi:hypothetical protein
MEHDGNLWLNEKLETDFNDMTVFPAIFKEFCISWLVRISDALHDAIQHWLMYIDSLIEIRGSIVNKWLVLLGWRQPNNTSWLEQFSNLWNKFRSVILQLRYVVWRYPQKAQESSLSRWWKHSLDWPCMSSFNIYCPTLVYFEVYSYSFHFVSVSCARKRYIKYNNLKMTHF